LPTLTERTSGGITVSSIELVGCGTRTNACLLRNGERIGWKNLKLFIIESKTKWENSTCGV